MSSYTSVAVAGAGGLGSFIVEELLNAKASQKIKLVTILTRASSNTSSLTKYSERGAVVAIVDYTSQSSIVSALAGIDVVISTFGLEALEAQQSLAEASKSAGVKLFVPSEFGNPTDSEQQGPMAHKVALQKRLKELDLPYTLVFTGPFTDVCLNQALDIDFEHGKAKVGGDGNTPVSWTARSDVASFLTYILTTLSPSELEWKTFRIEGERASFKQIFEAYEKKTGKKIEVSYRPLSELQTALASNPQDFASLLHLLWAVGQGQVGKPEQVSNGVFPQWNPKSVLDVVSP